MEVSVGWQAKRMPKTISNAVIARNKPFTSGPLSAAPGIFSKGWLAVGKQSLERAGNTHLSITSRYPIT
jgi:hypothetical protein